MTGEQEILWDRQILIIFKFQLNCLFHSHILKGGGLNPLAAPSNEGLFHYPFWPWGKWSGEELPGLTQTIIHTTRLILSRVLWVMDSFTFGQMAILWIVTGFFKCDKKNFIFIRSSTKWTKTSLGYCYEWIILWNKFFINKLYCKQTSQNINSFHKTW